MPIDDPFANLDAEAAEASKAKPRKRKPERFAQAIEVNRRDTLKATGKGEGALHGFYYQLTTRVAVELVDEIKTWANELKMTQQDVQRYCLYRGLQALKEGERPDVEEVVIKKRLKQPSRI